MGFAEAVRRCVETMGPDVVRDSRRLVSCLLDFADDSLALRAAARNLDDAALAPFVEALDSGDGGSLGLACAKVEITLRNERGLEASVAHDIASAICGALEERLSAAAGVHERNTAETKAAREAAKVEPESTREADVHAPVTAPATPTESGGGTAAVPRQGRGISRRVVIAGIGVLALAALAAGLGSAKDSTPGNASSGSGGESRVGDISNLSRTERAELFAMVVVSSKIANGQGSYIDYTQRDEDLTKLVAKTSDLYKYLTGTGSYDYVEYRICNSNFNSPNISERAHVMATDGDVYAVVADETATSETKQHWGPSEIVVIFDEDDMIEHAYSMDDYRIEVLGMQSQNDYSESFPISSDEEELSPDSGEDCVSFKTDDFAVELPGSWTLKRDVPSSRESVFGLQNEGYYFYSSEYHGQFEIALETFDLESYGGSWLCEVIGFNSNWKQVTIWWHNELPQDVKDYIVEHLTIL